MNLVIFRYEIQKNQHVPGPEPSGKPNQTRDSSALPVHSFPVVGIGASAGGLEALESFFLNMPTDSGLAFVVIQHLSPDYKSLMSELLARRTSLAIYRVEDGMLIRPNSIFLIPPKKNITILAGTCT